VAAQERVDLSAAAVSDLVAKVRVRVRVG